MTEIIPVALFTDNPIKFVTEMSESPRIDITPETTWFQWVPKYQAFRVYQQKDMP